MEMQVLSLDQMLPPDHVARVVWAYVEQVDVGPLLATIRSVEHHAGNPAIDPRVLLGLWLLATIQGVGSAREIERRTSEHTAYRWLAGGLPINYHTLNDFRSDQVAFLDQLLTTSVASLLHQQLIVLDRVAQDGMRVRASAGAGSFRRQSTLQKCLVEAEAHVQAVKAQAEGDPAAGLRRHQRLAEERRDRIQAALAETQQLAQQREKVEAEKGVAAKEPRASTTDPEARIMKMPDNGFRPAYNVQLATTTASGIIVGADVINQGSDSGQLTPMVEQVHQRYGAKPKEMLGDGGFATKEDIHTLHEEHQVQVYAPVKDENKKRAAGVDPFVPRKGDPEGVALWRQRMGSEAAKQVYAERAQTAEWANAGMRNRGLYQFRVRGLVKVKAVVLWYVLAHNLLRAVALRATADATPS
jgi:transposase/IS5 family transposase